MYVITFRVSQLMSCEPLFKISFKFFMYAIENVHQTYDINGTRQIKKAKLFYLKQILKLSKMK